MLLSGKLWCSSILPPLNGFRWTVNMMANEKIYHLRINPFFKDLLPPLSKKEYQTLEMNLRNEGCHEPICVWGCTILDGHKRYEICTRLSIPFKIKKIELYSEAEAIAWICAIHLGRQNISEETRRYLIGRRFEAEKTIFREQNPVGVNQFFPEQQTLPSEEYPELELTETVRINKTSEKLAKEYYISRPTVIKYGQYARAIVKIRKVDPVIANDILTGDIKISQLSVIDLAKLKNNRIKQICAQIREGNPQQLLVRRLVRKEIDEAFSENNKSGIESTHKQDLDFNSKLISLSLIIPDWIKMMELTCNPAHLEGSSIAARDKLLTHIVSLRRKCDQLIERIKEY